jgi:hypothetical protein
LFRDGDQWCALYGEDLQDGCSGFGDSPAQAMEAFDREWYRCCRPQGDLETKVRKQIASGRSVPADMPSVVCLCGSTRFMDTFHEVGWQLTLKGEIVLSVGVCKHAEHHGGEALGQDVADELDELHLRKIDIADYVYVLNVGGYIGQSTRKEIEYARKLGKPINYLE